MATIGTPRMRREVHRAGVVGHEQVAAPQFLDQLRERRSARARSSHGTPGAERSTAAPDRPILRHAEELPLGTRDASSDIEHHLGKTFRQPSFCRTILRARTNAKDQRRSGVPSVQRRCG